MQNDEDQSTESNTTRRQRTAANNRDVINDQQQHEPMLTIQATILTFLFMLFVVTPILVGIYTTIYGLASGIGFFYNMFIYSFMPVFPNGLVSDRVIKYLKIFLIIILIGFVVAIWRTTYYAIRVIIVLIMRIGEV